MKIVSKVYVLLPAALVILAGACAPVKQSGMKQSPVQELIANPSGSGPELTIQITPGKAHNHPSFAIWIESLEGEFLQTLFVTKSVGTGFYGHGKLDEEKWDKGAGPQSRPASLPYWLHKRLPASAEFYLPTPDNPVPDAYTGATPQGASEIQTRADQSLPQQVKVMMEVNQPWDWNDFWFNTKYDDADYRTSCQPSLIYYVVVDFEKKTQTWYMNPIGHGHYAGKDGGLYTDLSTLTTAKDIFSSIRITLNDTK